MTTESKNDYETRNIFTLRGKRLAHQTTETGWGSFLHRVALLDENDKVVQAGSENVYQHPAFLSADGRIYMALCAYYEGDAPKYETVYELTAPQESESDESAEKTFDERVDALMKGTLKNDIQEAFLILKVVQERKRLATKRQLAEAFLSLKDKLGDGFKDLFEA